MFQTKFQEPLISVYYSIGSRPLDNWSVHQFKEGEMQHVQDDLLKSNVLQLQSPNVNACCITCPMNPKGSLGVRLPFVTLLVKNLERFFTFEITIMDNENIRRRVRVSNYHTIKKLSTFMVTMPFCMNEGWNQLNLNLAAITSDSFKTTYVETVRVQVHANCRLRRIYFSDQLYKDDQLPNSYRLHGSKDVREKPKSMLRKNAVVIDKYSAGDKL
ncbi:cilia- and flagella-associated protein 20-like [Acyrthosiphon pisum]|uniref:CFA20 domain-containing protein n=1 Tax=Acyrthosiphon pisum TaxID=7029 RepID=A0A8R1W2S3_ACYPI|nr:cilia- and flagella-associated protein 20-like [Acyrthosiphon pisum]|eukprot:XP_001950958.1 PREDICTED: cilia- and flagella-associated protein 20-like [Acyrthosiphon pisum]